VSSSDIVPQADFVSDGVFSGTLFLREENFSLFSATCLREDSAFDEISLFRDEVL